ncbi:MAG: efflux RND transporter periplasmic adaptor subunit [Planctomycetes bacterium]|nr:efflux RND transporter periplasmic adaptor subunit [Planctomycetota bacterium]
MVKNGRQGRCQAAALLLLAAAGMLRVCGADEPEARAGTGDAANGGATAAADRGRWLTVEPRTLRRWVPTVGTLRARRRTQLGAQVSGRVRDVLVDVGDRVTAGQDLLRLDPVLFEIEVAQRGADVQAERVRLGEAELNLTRMRNLWDKPTGQAPSIPRKLYDDAAARREAAAAALAQAEGALRYAEERLREATIRAPYDGVVTRRLVDPGEPVTSAPVVQLLEIQEIAILDLEFALPQELLGRVRAGTAVEFAAEGVEPAGMVGARVAVVFPALDEATRSFRCRVQVENADLRYRPGLLVRVRVVEREVESALVVPRGALVAAAAGGGFSVLVEENGRSTAHPVITGIDVEEEVEVREGLAPGARVWVPR